MSDEFKNINDTGSEPEKGMEHSNDGSYTQGDSFVMRSSEETRRKQKSPGRPPRNLRRPPARRILIMPILTGKLPNQGRKAAPALQKGLQPVLRRKKRKQKEINTVLTSSLLPYLRRRTKRRKKEMVPAQ